MQDEKGGRGRKIQARLSTELRPYESRDASGNSCSAEDRKKGRQAAREPSRFCEVSEVVRETWLNENS